MLAFLRKTLDWRVSDDADSLRDATYAWSHDELQLDETRANIQFRQLTPFVQNQWAGVFIVKFPEITNAYKTALRKAIGRLVTKKRGGYSSKASALENLFFICTPNYQDFTVAHYSGESVSKAKLQTFSWERGSLYLRTLCEYNLPALALPESLDDEPAWRKQWLSAFDVEKVTKKFFADFEAAFQTLLAKHFATSGKDNSCGFRLPSTSSTSSSKKFPRHPTSSSKSDPPIRSKEKPCWTHELPKKRCKQARFSMC